MHRSLVGCGEGHIVQCVIKINTMLSRNCMLLIHSRAKCPVYKEQHALAEYQDTCPKVFPPKRLNISSNTYRDTLQRDSTYCNDLFICVK